MSTVANLAFLLNSTEIEAIEGDMVNVCAQIIIRNDTNGVGSLGIASDFPISLTLNMQETGTGNSCCFFLRILYELNYFFTSDLANSSDFMIASNSLPLNESPEVCFGVTLTDDSEIEGTENIIFDLQSTPNEERIPFSTPISNITLLDNDGK